MSIYSISSIFASLLNIVVCSISIYSRKTKSHYALAGITFLISIWTLFPFLTSLSHNPQIQLQITQFIYFAAAQVPFSFLFLTLSILHPQKFEKKGALLICFIIGIVFSFLSFNKSFIEGIGENGGARFVLPGPLYPGFVAYFGIICGIAFYELIREYSQSSGLKRNQIKYFFAGFIFAYIGGGIHFITAYSQQEPFPHDFLVALFALILGYAILRFKLMEFDLLIRWGLAYGVVAVISGAFFFLVIYSTSGLFKSGIPGLPYWIGCFALLMVYDPLKRKIIYFVDQYVFQSPDFRAILEDISRILRSSEKVETLADQMTQKIKEIWKVDHAGVVLWDATSSQFKPYPRETFEKIGVQGEDVNLFHSDFLIRTLESERRLFHYGIVLDDEVDMYGTRSSAGERATFNKILRTMKKLGAAACVPITIGEQLMGFIVLGPKKSGALYNREDKKFLSHVGKLISEQINHLIYSPHNKPATA